MGRARHRVPTESWIGSKLATKPKMLVGIVLAHTMARLIWTMLTKTTITGIRRWRGHDPPVVTCQLRCQGECEKPTT